MKFTIGFLKSIKREVWALTEDAHDILSVAYDKLRSYTLTEKDSEILASAIGQKNAGAPRYTVDADGIATLAIRGVLMREPGMIEELCFGATSTKQIESDYLKAIDDSNVKAILLDIDSPGGTVSGTQRLSRVISENKTKPVVAFTAATMASAAYWIGSSADAIVAEQTADIGSVGVILTHVDQSKANEMEGLKVTHITAGEDKAMGSPHKPLDDKTKLYLQKMVDDSMAQFKAGLQTNRGNKMNVESIANGRIYTASDALSLGLIDKIGMVEDAVSLLKGEATMTLAELKANQPELVAELTAELQAAFDLKLTAETEKVRSEEKAKADALVVEKLEAEKKRMADIRALAFKGQETLAEELIAQGKTADEAAKAFNADMRSRIEKGIAQEPVKPADAIEAAKAQIKAVHDASAPVIIEQPSKQKEGNGESMEKQVLAITDPVARAKFVAENKAAIDAELKAK